MKQVVFLIVITFLLSCNPEKKQVPVTPETALERYLHNGDNTFAWEIKESFDTENLTVAEILLTSQKWREHTWNHQLTLLIPNEIKYDGALLFITGGSNENGQPNWKSIDDKWTQVFAGLARKNSAVVAIVRQTPNQPLYNDLVEDQLISFTLHNFKQDKDYSWPLLFPMVKTAVKAMDVVEQYADKNLDVNITRFTVAGASKRGWTTWLTGSQDHRVEAIGPMVIDVLNMPVNLDYQTKVWNEYSVQIEDYVKLEIPQQVHSEEGDAITKMVDPYSYREKLSLPKMIFIGTNDEYWPVDAIKNYIDEIPGENNIHYVPNAGHDLGGGEQALKALSAFWGTILDKNEQPGFTYSVSTDSISAKINISCKSEMLVNSYLWHAASDDRDFRDEAWTADTLPIDGNSFAASVLLPKSGYIAFYIDLEFEDPKGGTYTKSTRMYVVNNKMIL